MREGKCMTVAHSTGAYCPGRLLYSIACLSLSCYLLVLRYGFCGNRVGKEKAVSSVDAGLRLVWSIYVCGWPLPCSWSGKHFPAHMWSTLFWQGTSTNANSTAPKSGFPSMQSWLCRPGSHGFAAICNALGIVCVSGSRSCIWEAGLLCSQRSLLQCLVLRWTLPSFPPGIGIIGSVSLYWCELDSMDCFARGRSWLSVPRTFCFRGMTRRVCGLPYFYCRS